MNTLTMRKALIDLYGPIPENALLYFMTHGGFPNPVYVYYDENNKKLAYSLNKNKWEKSNYCEICDQLGNEISNIPADWFEKIGIYKNRDVVGFNDYVKEYRAKKIINEYNHFKEQEYFEP